MLSSQPPAQLRIASRLSHWQIGTILLVVLVQGTGCVSLAANLLYAIRGNDLPAEYAGLNGKRVALLCDVDCAVANDAASSLLTSYIGAILSQRLAKSELVKQDEVERWREIEGWSGGNPAAVGSGVNADQVVAVQVTNLKLRDGATLFRGRCDIEVSVYDVAADGQLVFQKQIGEHAYPLHGGIPVTDTTETSFRSAYLQLVARRVASLFHPVDPTADYALDATAARF